MSQSEPRQPRREREPLREERERPPARPVNVPYKAYRPGEGLTHPEDPPNVGVDPRPRPDGKTP